MKKIQGLYLFVAAMFLNAVAFAQDKGLDVNVDVNKGGNNWYANPIIWVVAGAIFILLLVALLRGGKK